MLSIYCLGIQSVVSRINPQLLRSVIAAGAAAMPPAKAALLFSSSSSSPSPPVTILNPSIRFAANPSFYSLKMYNHRFLLNLTNSIRIFQLQNQKKKKISRSVAETPNETAPLTIFYNGSVAIFDLPRDKVGYCLFPIQFPFSLFFL